ncbi:hypothetical protein DRO31_02930 [Candidatus Bathyarchaeota archaeon]|nr:MAG: hypothetical protein DRO31_02930 [Candidatus Bathyarchaeota archaeon]
MTLRELFQKSEKEIEKLPLKDLLFKHTICHMLFKTMKRLRLKVIAGLTREELKKLHDKIVKAMKKKGATHNIVDEELDRTTAEKQAFLPFRIRHPFASLVGSLVASPTSANDVDILINGDLNDEIVRLTMGIISSRLEGIEVHFIDYFYYGPFSPYIPLFALTLRPHRPREIAFGFAPLLPKTPTGRLQVSLNEVLNRIGGDATLFSPFVYFDPQNLVFAHPKVSGVYSVPLMIRLTRMFPDPIRSRIRVKEVYPNEVIGGNFVPVYDLVLERLEPKKIEM